MKLEYSELERQKALQSKKCISCSKPIYSKEELFHIEMPRFGGRAKILTPYVYCLDCLQKVNRYVRENYKTPGHDFPSVCLGCASTGLFRECAPGYGACEDHLFWINELFREADAAFSQARRKDQSDDPWGETND